MTRPTQAALAAILGLTLLSPAHADTRPAPAPRLNAQPAAGYPLDLGDLQGTGYYIDTPKGYHLVLTLRAEDAPPVRFEADLAAGQAVELSTPRLTGEPARTIRIARDGDRLTIAHPAEPARLAAE